jgi:hypothetical protein
MGGRKNDHYQSKSCITAMKAGLEISGRSAWLKTPAPTQEPVLN